MITKWLLISATTTLVIVVNMGDESSLALEQRGIRVAGAVGMVSGLQGDAFVTRDGVQKEQPIKFQDNVHERDLVTTSERAQAELLLGSAMLLTILPDSVVVITDNRSLELRQGSIDLALPNGRLSDGETVFIETPGATVRASDVLMTIQAFLTNPTAPDHQHKNASVTRTTHGRTMTADSFYVREGTAEIIERTSGMRTSLSAGRGISITDHAMAAQFKEPIPTGEQIKPIPAVPQHADVGEVAQRHITDLHTNQVIALSEIVLRGAKGSTTAEGETGNAADGNVPTGVSAGYLSTSAALTSSGSGLLTSSVSGAVSLPGNGSFNAFSSAGASSLSSSASVSFVPPSPTGGTTPSTAFFTITPQSTLPTTVTTLPTTVTPLPPTVPTLPITVTPLPPTVIPLPPTVSTLPTTLTVGGSVPTSTFARAPLDRAGINPDTLKVNPSILNQNIRK